MPAVLGQSTSFALNGPPFTSMANQQNAATNRGDRASACDEVACVKTALRFNKKKPHPMGLDICKLVMVNFLPLTRRGDMLGHDTKS